MISPQPQTNLRNAKEYFKIHLAAGDYCAVRSAQYLTQENAVVGEWFGQGAARLNLAGIVTESAFVALCDGNDPATGERLTARRNNFPRQDGKLVANRRVFYDWSFGPQKSLSIVAYLQDERIVGANERAVTAARFLLDTRRETAKQIEREGLRGEIEAVRRQVARDKRHRKNKDSTADRLRESWKTQHKSAERSALKALVKPGPVPARLAADLPALLAWGSGMSLPAGPWWPSRSFSLRPCRTTAANTSASGRSAGSSRKGPRCLLSTGARRCPGNSYNLIPNFWTPDAILCRKRRVA